jgi:hypothetical protein
VKPDKLGSLDIDDTFCAAHSIPQLAFWALRRLMVEAGGKMAAG